MKPKPLLLLDFDGPIVDVQRRYYQIYIDLLHRYRANLLGKQEYWHLKKMKTPEKDILIASGATAAVDSYMKARMAVIETQDYLHLDEIHPFVIPTLEKLVQTFDLALVTLRSSKSLLLSELERFHIAGFFKAVLSSGEPLSPRWKIKEKLVNAFLKENDYNVVAIAGDTETDINAGHALGCKAIFVRNGIRYEHMIQPARADHAINDIQLLPSLLETIS